MMKVVYLIVVVVLFSLEKLSANVEAQKLNLKMDSVSVQQIFEEIESRTGLGFLYEGDELDEIIFTNVHYKNVTLSNILDSLLSPLGKAYRIKKNIVLIFDKEETNIPKKVVQNNVVNGFVTDQSGLPIRDIRIREKGTSNFTVTSDDGFYELTVTDIDSSILFLLRPGRWKQQIEVKGRNRINIGLFGDK